MKLLVYSVDFLILLHTCHTCHSKRHNLCVLYARSVIGNGNCHCHSCHLYPQPPIVREHGGVNYTCSCPTNQREYLATWHLNSLPFMQLVSIICAHQAKLEFSSVQISAPAHCTSRQWNPVTLVMLLSYNCAFRELASLI